MAAAAAPQPAGGSGAPAAAERLALTNGSGLELAGLFTRAVSPTDRCVILCHGYAGTKEDMALPQLAQVRWVAQAPQRCCMQRASDCAQAESFSHTQIANAGARCRGPQLAAL